MPRAAGSSPGGPGDRFWRPKQPSQFCPGDYRATPGKDSGFCSGRQIRSPGPAGLIPAALDISQSRKTRWATQAPTREPVFTRRFDIFTEQPPGVCGRPTKSVSFRVFSVEYAAFMDTTVPTGSITSHTPLINQVSRPYLIHSHVVARARRCDGRRVVLYGGRNHIYAPWRPRASESRAPLVRDWSVECVK